MMRRLMTRALILTSFLTLGGVARGQVPYAGPGFGTLGMPDGLYTTISVPGMGRGGPGLWMYFPSTGMGGSFTPSPMAGMVAGVQVPVVGTSGSVYLPTAGSPAMPQVPIRGGLGLPSPVPPLRAVAPPAVAARPAPAPASKKAAPKARAEAEAEAPAADEAKKPPARSTLKERRGIR